MKNIDIINRKIIELNKSKFRNSFKLKVKDLEYVFNRWYDVIEEYAYKFVKERLSNKEPLNDGKQTPMRGCPVFVA